MITAMSSTQQPQDHPGPEWVWLHKESALYCPGLNIRVAVGPTEAIEASYPRCRAISAAALEWEFRRGVSFGQGLANASNFQHLIRGLAQ